MSTARTPAIAGIDLGNFAQTGIAPRTARFASRKLGSQSILNRMSRRLSDWAQVERVFVVGAGILTSILNSGLAGVD